MKTANLGEYFLWNDQLTQVIHINPGKKSIGFKIKKKTQCPCCKEEFEQDDWHDIIESSPLFQDNAKPITTINDNKTQK